jgi:transposase InsO family protein
VIVQQGTASTVEACDVMELSRSAYYAWKNAMPTPRQIQDQLLEPVVTAIFVKHRHRYGTRRIVVELRDRGHASGRRRVAKLMKIRGLRAIQPKSFKPRSTESRHRLGYSPNLLLDAPEITACDRLWVGDITYLPIRGRTFSYLATLMDQHSRRMIGWQIAEDMTELLVLQALKSAIRARQPGSGLIHHTDRGGQYAGSDYRAILRRAAMLQSMSRAGNCYDNAFMESCFGTIKTELEISEYESHGAAEIELREYIKYYNEERKHSALGYLTPNQFEAIHRSPK